jgi:hypothetical protein
MANLLDDDGVCFYLYLADFVTGERLPTDVMGVLATEELDWCGVTWRRSFEMRHTFSSQSIP